ncbi:atlastin-1-like, partial [Anneissia japonica]|uniref:atlastin-1-like n=1 Tax=Anneissia japonica TaxID=1529436 RepID=UPI0014258E3D
MSLYYTKSQRVVRDLDRVEGTQVQIASVREGKLEINKKVLENILMKPQWKDERVMVLSIAGIFQSGKSFLLNLLIRYLSQNCKDRWMDNQESNVDRFDWSKNTGTSGIWMWSKVFYILDSDGIKFGVLLMDTQGTPDPYSATNEDALLFAFSTLISSIQIYNLKSDINDADLQFLQQVARYGTSVTGDKKPFKSLLFLIRDWQNQHECNFGKDGGIKCLTKCMDKNQDLKQSIHQVFENISCFLMPRPVENAWNTSICQVKDIVEQFLVQMKALFKILFSSKISEVKEIDGDDVTCARLLDYFQLYEKSINKVKFEIASKIEPRREYLHVGGGNDSGSSGTGGARASAAKTATVVTKIGNSDSVYKPKKDKRVQSEPKC